MRTADDTNGQTGPREGLAHDQIFRKVQLPAQLTNLILKEKPQRLDDLFEIHIVRKTAHIVVALDDSGIPQAGLDHIGVNGALDQVIYLADLFRINPGSTKTQVTWLPTASATRAAATEESTPPERARSTLPFPTFSRICRMAVVL